MKNVIYKTAGKLAKAIIVENEDKSRTAHITFASGAKLHLPTEQINLRAMCASDAAEAVKKTCHSTGNIARYKVTETNGAKALTRCYSSIHKGIETGYGILVRRGEKARTFALSRIDLGKMKAKDAVTALRKAAYIGGVALTPKATPAKAA